MKFDLSQLALHTALLCFPGLAEADDLREGAHEAAAAAGYLAGRVRSYVLHALGKGRHADLEKSFPAIDKSFFADLVRNPRDTLCSSYLFESPEFLHST